MKSKYHDRQKRKSQIWLSRFDVAFVSNEPPLRVLQSIQLILQSYAGAWPRTRLFLMDSIWNFIWISIWGPHLALTCCSDLISSCCHWQVTWDRKMARSVLSELRGSSTERTPITFSRIKIQELLATFSEGHHTHLIWFSDPGWTDLYWEEPVNLHRSFWWWKHPLISLSIFGPAGCWRALITYLVPPELWITGAL